MGFFDRPVIAASSASGCRPAWLAFRQIAVEHDSVDVGQRLDVADRHAFVGGMHGAPDQADLGGRAEVLDKACVGGSAGGGEFGVPDRFRSGPLPAGNRRRVRARRRRLPRFAIAFSSENVRPLVSAASAIRDSSQVVRLEPVWASLNRMLRTASAAPGMTLEAGLPVSIEVIARVEGENRSVPVSSSVAARSATSRASGGSGFRARSG